MTQHSGEEILRKLRDQGFLRDPKTAAKIAKNIEAELEKQREKDTKEIQGLVDQIKRTRPDILGLRDL